MRLIPYGRIITLEKNGVLGTVWFTPYFKIIFIQEKKKKKREGAANPLDSFNRQEIRAVSAFKMNYSYCYFFAHYRDLRMSVVPSAGSLKSSMWV